MRFESRGPSEFATESALTEIAWEDAVQGLSRAMSTVASEKKQGVVVYQQRVWQRVTTLRVVSSPSVSRARPPENLKSFPSKKRDFRYGKQLVPGESGGRNGA